MVLINSSLHGLIIFRDISIPNFEFATTSRIEDTGTVNDIVFCLPYSALGTSQQYIPSYYAVHLALFVAYGIAKKTDDYLEAVYRWSTGAVELFWATMGSSSVTHYIVIALVGASYGAACFVAGIAGLLSWWITLLLLMVSGLVEKAYGRRPLRLFVVSSVIVQNTTYFVSNLASIVWMIFIPISTGKS